MSFIDAIFIFLYALCGLALGRFCATHIGPVYGIFGFIIGFILPMTLWRFIAPRIGVRRKNKKNSQESSIDDETN
jgi:hypothetical protein